MNEYSFLEGIITGGTAFFDYCKSKGFDRVYNSLPNFPPLKKTADAYMRDGFIDLLKRIADSLDPGINRSEYYISRTNYEIPKCLMNSNCNSLINQGFDLIKKLKDTYVSSSIDPDSFNKGINLLINTINNNYSKVAFKNVINSLSKLITGFDIDDTFNEGIKLARNKLLRINGEISC